VSAALSLEHACPGRPPVGHDQVARTGGASGTINAQLRGPMARRRRDRAPAWTRPNRRRRRPHRLGHQGGRYRWRRRRHDRGLLPGQTGFTLQCRFRPAHRGDRAPPASTCWSLRRVSPSAPTRSRRSARRRSGARQRPGHVRPARACRRRDDVRAVAVRGLCPGGLEQGGARLHRSVHADHGQLPGCPVATGPRPSSAATSRCRN